MVWTFAIPINEDPTIHWLELDSQDGFSLEQKLKDVSTPRGRRESSDHENKNQTNDDISLHKNHLIIEEYFKKYKIKNSEKVLLPEHFVQFRIRINEKILETDNTSIVVAIAPSHATINEHWKFVAETLLPIATKVGLNYHSPFKVEYKRSYASEFLIFQIFSLINQQIQANHSNTNKQKLNLIKIEDEEDHEEDDEEEDEEDEDDVGKIKKNEEEGELEGKNESLEDKKMKKIEKNANKVPLTIENVRKEKTKLRTNSDVSLINKNLLNKENQENQEIKEEKNIIIFGDEKIKFKLNCKLISTETTKEFNKINKQPVKSCINSGCLILTKNYFYFTVSQRSTKLILKLSEIERINSLPDTDVEFPSAILILHNSRREFLLFSKNSVDLKENLISTWQNCLKKQEKRLQARLHQQTIVSDQITNLPIHHSLFPASLKLFKFFNKKQPSQSSGSISAAINPSTSLDSLPTANPPNLLSSASASLSTPSISSSRRRGSRLLASNSNPISSTSLLSNSLNFSSAAPTSSSPPAASTKFIFPSITKLPLFSLSPFSTATSESCTCFLLISNLFRFPIKGWFSFFSFPTPEPRCLTSGS